MIIQKYLVGALGGQLPSTSEDHSSSCDTIDNGYRCSPEISRYWGQYSPYFSVNSTISTAIPSQCSVTFAQVLSRHGARAPTRNKTREYANTISKIQNNTVAYDQSVNFLRDLTYSLGADELTVFGEQELYNSGFKFYDRYTSLANTKRLFIRASGESRVIQSARNFTQGFDDAMLGASPGQGPGQPHEILVISEECGSHNPLHHGLCTNWQNENSSTISKRGKGPWTSIFVPPIQTRLNQLLLGANLTVAETINMMDLCPYYTVENPAGAIDTRFCSLFTPDEWKQYDYYQSLDKYYRYGSGDPLGPTQGVGWTNELISRLTHKPVQDDTSTNSTLDCDSATFPIGDNDVLFADFSHDNDITTIMFALGLYNSTTDLSGKEIQEASDVGGYSASWTVPFSSRLYVEKLVCEQDMEKEYVRFIVNDRVVPLSCSDSDGKCRLDDYLSTLQFARSGGRWAQCFT